MSDLPLPLPYGVPRGPQLPTQLLFARWLEGSSTGACSDAHVEGSLLVAGDHPLAIRIDGAVLVRDVTPGEIETTRRALEGFLASAGLELIEEDAALGALVGIEVSGLRGDAWSLWARDADAGQAALVRRAAGDMPGLLDTGEADRRAAVDAALEEIERRL